MMQVGSIRAWGIAVAVALAAMVGAFVLPSPAHADPGIGDLTLLMDNPQKGNVAIGGVAVTLVYSDSDSGQPGPSGVTDATGRVTFTDLTAGYYEAYLTPPAAGAATRAAVVKKVFVAGDLHNYDGVVIPIGGSVGGTVRSAAGSPVVGAEVIARSSTDPNVSRSAVTDASGHFWVRGLATGRYAIEYNARSSAAAFGTQNATGSPATLGWSFWGQAAATPYAGATTYVMNANYGQPQSVADGYDGVVHVGTPLELVVQPQGSTDFTHATLLTLGDTVGGTFSIPVTGARGAQSVLHEVVNPGRYRIGVTGVGPTGAPVTYWWTGNTTPPTTDAAAASWATVGTTSTVLWLGS